MTARKIEEPSRNVQDAERFLKDNLGSKQLSLDDMLSKLSSMSILKGEDKQKL